MAPFEEEEVPRPGPALIVGATGYIGRFVAEACLDSGRRTFILVRPGNACPARAASVDALLRKGALVVEVSSCRHPYTVCSTYVHVARYAPSEMPGPRRRERRREVRGDGAPRARRRGGDLGDGRRQHPRPARPHQSHPSRRHRQGTHARTRQHLQVCVSTAL